MAGRFPLYIDADIYGPLVDGLIRRGWDVVRAVKSRPEGEDDLVHFTLAAEQNRVLVAYDRHQRQIALDWIEAGKPFRGYITWKQKQHERMSVGEEAFDALAAEDDPLRLQDPLHHAEALRRARSRPPQAALRRGILSSSPRPERGLLGNKRGAPPPAKPAPPRPREPGCEVAVCGP